MSKYILFALCLVSFLCMVHADPVLKNGDFEIKDKSSRPSGWWYSKKGEVDCSAVVTTEEKYSGNSSLKITNRTSQQPNKFLRLVQDVKLKPDTKYTLSFYAKGKNVNSIMFAAGSKWRPRFPLTNVSSDWKKYEFTFLADKKYFNKNGTYSVMILSDDITEYVYIDDVKIEPADYSIVDVLKPQESQAYLLKKIGDIDITKLKDIPASLPVLTLPLNSGFYTGNLSVDKGFMAKAAWAWNDSGVLLFIKVGKNSSAPVSTLDGKDMWRRDSIQIRFNTKGVVKPGTYDGDIDISLAPGTGKAVTYSHDLRRELNDFEIESFSKKTSYGYFIVAQFKWELLYGLYAGGKLNAFSMNMIVNFYNQYGQRYVAFLADGVHVVKSNANNTIMIPTIQFPYINHIGFEESVNEKLKGKVIVCGDYPENWKLTTTVTDSKNKTLTFPLTVESPINKRNFAVINIDLPIGSLSKGKLKVDFSAETLKASSLEVVKGDPMEMALRGVAVAQEELRKIEEKMNRLKKQSAYLTIPLVILKEQIKIQAGDLKICNTPERTKFYTDRCKRVTKEINMGIDILKSDLAKAETKGFPETWKYISSPNIFKNTWMYGKSRSSTGEVKTRPVFLAGYGHFNQIVPFIPFFNKIDSNFTQIEIGPFYLFKNMKQFKDKSKWSQKYLNEYIYPTLKKAWKNNIKVTLLVSPHYMPKQIILKDCPEIKMRSLWKFTAYDRYHPTAKKILEDYIRYIVPKIRDSKYAKNIHSLCLCNEPGAQTYDLNNKLFRSIFLKYLQDKFTNVTEFNNLTGRSYNDFEDFLKESSDDPIMHYEFISYKRKSMADWYVWFAKIIREYWDIPLHSKIMVYRTLAPVNMQAAVEPELFSDLNDLNGNDNHAYYSPKGTWMNGWVSHAMYHNMQRSFKKSVVLNTENHVIIDGSIGFVPFEHLYTTTFQQFSQGVEGLVTWVWRPAAMEWIKKEPGKAGMSIYRPLSIMGQAKATLDANRMAKELVAFADADPQIYILYSPTSYIWNASQYNSDTRNLFTHLSFTGLKPGFISERKLAKGQWPQSAKVIYAVSSPYITQEALDGLQKFVKQGGKVVTVGDCFKYNEYGKKLPAGPAVTQLSNNIKGMKYVNALKKTTSNIAPVVQVVSNKVDGVNGIQWVAVDTPEGYFVNIVNYNSTPRRISLKSSKDFKAVDLISEDEVTTMNINPLNPLFIKVDFK